MRHCRAAASVSLSCRSSQATLPELAGGGGGGERKLAWAGGTANDIELARRAPRSHPTTSQWNADRADEAGNQQQRPRGNN